LVDQRRECVFRDNIPVAVLTQITAVPQHILEAAFHKLSAVAGSYAASVHTHTEFLDGFSPGVALEHLSNNGAHHWVRLVVAFLVDAVAQRHRTAIELAFQRIVRMATRHFLRQFSRIILRHALQHTFQHDSLRRVGDGLRCGNHLDVVLGKCALVVCGVKAVAGKSIQFPHKDELEPVGVAVLDHLLELRSRVRFC